MSTFDRDDDVRRNESDELHGIAGGWFDPPVSSGPRATALSEYELVAKRASAIRKAAGERYQAACDEYNAAQAAANDLDRIAFAEFLKAEVTK